MSAAPEHVLAEEVLVPRWWCTFGTRVMVVAAETRSDARAIVAHRVAQVHSPDEVHVRRFYADDADRLARIEALERDRGLRPVRSSLV